MSGKKIILACPHGLCAGVDRALKMMELALEKYGTPVYCLNEIVHNPIVVSGFSEKGVIFVNNLSEVPEGRTVLFSAHGVSPDIRVQAESMKLRVLDATCPFVEKIHSEVRRWAAEGLTIFLVGHRNHEEIEGIAGEAPDNVVVVENPEQAAGIEVENPKGYAVATQTTLSMEQAEKVIAVLGQRYSGIRRASRGDICYATLNRQKAVRALGGLVDMVLVIGARNSSNSNRLVEVARDEGMKACLVDTLAVLDDLNFSGISTIGVTAGASTPERFTEEVLARLRGHGYDNVERMESVREVRELRLPEI